MNMPSVIYGGIEVYLKECHNDDLWGWLVATSVGSNYEWSRDPFILT